MPDCLYTDKTDFKTEGNGMKRKGRKRLLELKEDIPFVHLNVKSGYISYIEVPKKERRPRVKGVLLGQEETAAEAQ